MADLVVLGYPDKATAERAYAKVQELQKDFVIDGTSATLTRRSSPSSACSSSLRTTAVELATGAVSVGVSTIALADAPPQARRIRTQGIRVMSTSASNWSHRVASTQRGRPLENWLRPSRRAVLSPAWVGRATT